MSSFKRLLGGIFVFVLIAIAIGAIYAYRADLLSRNDRNVSGEGGMMQIIPEGQSYGLSVSTAKNSSPAPVRMSLVADSAVKPESSSDRIVIKTGYISLAVKDVRIAVRSIIDFATRSGGFVIDSRVENQQESIAPYGSIAIRIPVSSFDSGFGEARALGTVLSENSTGQDFTEEYSDLDARLRNELAAEARFLEILKGAKKIPDILLVEKELSRVRQNIEQMQGRMKYLRDNSRFSTLTVNLSTDVAAIPVKPEPKDEWKPWSVAKEAARSLLVVGKELANVFIWVGVFAPIWLGALIVIWLVRLIYRRREKKAKNLTLNI